MSKLVVFDDSEKTHLVWLMLLGNTCDSQQRVTMSKAVHNVQRVADLSASEYRYGCLSEEDASSIILTGQGEGMQV